MYIPGRTWAMALLPLEGVAMSLRRGSRQDGGDGRVERLPSQEPSFIGLAVEVLVR